MARRLEETRPTGVRRARGLVSDPSSGRRIDVRTFAPPPSLASIVDSFWRSRWDLRGQPSHTAEILADPCVTIAFEADANRVVGVNRGLLRREMSAQGLIRAVKLRPGAARTLLDVPTTLLSDRVVPFRSRFPTAPVSLEDQILSPLDDETAFEPLIAWLEQRTAGPTDANVSLAVALVDHVRRHAEILRVDELQRVAGLSLRPLQRLFRDYVGATPKWVIRRFRLQEAAVRIEQGDADLATLAAELGYADHAHLSRDFRSATGRTPSALADLTKR